MNTGTRGKEAQPRLRRRGRQATLVVMLLAALAAVALGCGGGSSNTANGAEATVATAAVQPGSTSSSQPQPVTTTAVSGGATVSTTGSSTLTEPCALLTDEEAAEFFGKPAKHEGPEKMGAFTNCYFTPADGTGGSITITTSEIGSLEAFETFVKSQAEALQDEGQKVGGVGEGAYYFAEDGANSFSVSGLLQFYRNGGMYQVLAITQPDGHDMMTVLTDLAKKMDSRIP